MTFDPESKDLCIAVVGTGAGASGLPEKCVCKLCPQTYSSSNVIRERSNWISDILCFLSMGGGASA